MRQKYIFIRKPKGVIKDLKRFSEVECWEKPRSKTQFMQTYVLPRRG